MKWNHRGVEIELLEQQGKFRSVIDGMGVTKPSLDAMKKHIDEVMEQKKSFAAFKAMDFNDPLRLNSWPAFTRHSKDDKKHEPEFFTVTDLTISRGRGRHASDQKNYKTDLKRKAYWDDGLKRSVIADTPENRKLVDDYLDMCSEASKVCQAYKEKVDALREKIKWREANNET